MDITTILGLCIVGLAILLGQICGRWAVDREYKYRFSHDDRCDVCGTKAEMLISEGEIYCCAECWPKITNSTQGSA